METIEKLIEKEASYQKIGRDKFLELFREITDNEINRNVRYDYIKKDLLEIGKITRFCTNPYAALISIRDIYTISETKIVQKIISQLYFEYESRIREIGKKYMRNLKFTPDEINDLISMFK